MRTTKPSLLPSVDVMEPRLLLSTGVPLASAHVLTRVDHLVKSIVTSLARTDDTVQANANLSSLASQIAPALHRLPCRGKATSRSIDQDLRSR